MQLSLSLSDLKQQSTEYKSNEQYKMPSCTGTGHTSTEKQQQQEYSPPIPTLAAATELNDAQHHIYKANVCGNTMRMPHENAKWNGKITPKYGM